MQWKYEEIRDLSKPIYNDFKSWQVVSEIWKYNTIIKSKY